MAEQTNIEKYELANKWIRLQNKKISILQGLIEKGIKKVILYGASEFCMRLIEECEKENNVVKIIGIADRNIISKGGYYKDIPLITIDDILNIDANDSMLIITAMGFYKEISIELKSKGINNFLSLRELIYDNYC